MTTGLSVMNTAGTNAQSLVNEQVRQIGEMGKTDDAGLMTKIAAEMSGTQLKSAANQAGVKNVERTIQNGVS